MTTATWWPLGGDPYPLIDGWMDGAIEERCWVPVKVIDGPEYAEERALRGRLAACCSYLTKMLDYAYVSLDEDGLTLELSEQTAWMRPEPGGFMDDDGMTYLVPTDDECDDHYESEDPCSRCKGTGKLHLHYDEGIPWQDCKPEDANAVEFYVLEAVEQDA